MKKQYIMGLLFGISLGLSPLSYSMLEDDWEMVRSEHKAVQPLADFFTAYEKADDKQTFANSANGIQMWKSARDTLGLFVLNNSKNYIGVQDKDLLTALSQFLLINDWWYKVITGKIKTTPAKTYLALSALGGEKDLVIKYLTKKHITKNKEEARLALLEATKILANRIGRVTEDV